VLALWIRHLALCAAGAPAPSLLVTRVKDKGPRVDTFRPLAVPEAKAYLDELVRLFVEGQERPLRFLPITSFAYAAALTKTTKKAGPKTPAEALVVARAEYDGKETSEAARDAHAPLAFDRRLPPFDERFDASERELGATEFHALATGVFGPILARVEEERL
jgi:exonuclease V gamma subunit